LVHSLLFVLPFFPSVRKISECFYSSLPFHVFSFSSSLCFH
jgi:hypothetical protein